MAKTGKQIVVIGAGIGGVSVAALLQARGQNVTLLERNAFVGGKCTGFEKDGFNCDFAFHIYALCESGPLGEVNRRVRGDLQWHKSHPLGTLGFQDRGWMTLPESIPWIIPYGGKAFLQGVVRPNVFNLLYRTLKNYGIFGLLKTMYQLAFMDEAFLQTLDNVTMRDFLLTFTDDVTLHRMMAVFSFLLVVVPYSEASAAEVLFCFGTMFKKGSMGYPKGGARAIGQSFAKAFTRDGGVLRTGCQVKRILVEGGRVTGVETGEGEVIPADVVISNAGIKVTVDMAGEDQFPAEYVQRVKNLKYSRSASVIKYGLGRRLPELPRHFFQHLPTESPAEIQTFLEGGQTPPKDSFVIIKPTDWDPSLAPQDKEIVILGMVGPSEINPENISFCEGRLQNGQRHMFELFPRFKDHIEWEQQVTIEQVAALTGRNTGECIGLSQCVGQTGLNKPKAATPIENLWLVGSDAGARGVGTEQAAASALYVSYQVGERQ